MITPFMFGVGIENSYPTINGGRTRIDQMEKCDHYRRWREDFELVRELSIGYLRYGPPIHLTWLGDGRYDWDFADQTFRFLEGQDCTPIVDLCHFGVPDWVGDFQNPDFPYLFAAYARDFSRRFPWVQLYTPVNEMFVCAMFSAAYGWWNEQRADDRSFVTALKHIVKANVLAMHAILDERPDAIFVQSESSEHFHPESPAVLDRAAHLNARRFLSLDLNYGRPVDSGMFCFLMDSGMTREEYEFFLARNLKHHSVMGNDYYDTNEHLVREDGSTCASGEIFGYAEITRQYFDRYQLPVMHTETNCAEGPRGDEAVRWLHKEWTNVLRVRDSGVPVVGFTWYSLTDQVDWDTALREENGRVVPLGLFDLDRRSRAVGRAYAQMIHKWCTVLPGQSVCLSLPVVPPSEYGAAWVGRQQAMMRDRRQTWMPRESQSSRGARLVRRLWSRARGKMASPPD